VYPTPVVCESTKKKDAALAPDTASPFIRGCAEAGRDAKADLFRIGECLGWTEILCRKLGLDSGAHRETSRD